ncbi:MAG: hypothetical protein ACK4FM_02825 [Caldimicrobium sp.]
MSYEEKRFKISAFHRGNYFASEDANVLVQVAQKGRSAPCYTGLSYVEET